MKSLVFATCIGAVCLSATAEDVCYILSGSRSISVSEDTSFANDRVEVSGPAVTTSTGWLPPESVGSVRFANVDLADVKSISGSFGIYVSLTGVGFGPTEKTDARTATTAVFQYQYVGKYSSGSGYQGYVDITLRQEGPDIVASATKWGNQSVSSAADANKTRGTYWEWTSRNGIANYKYTDAAYNYGVSFKNLSLTLKGTPISALPIVNAGAAVTPTVTFGEIVCNSPLALTDVNLQIDGKLALGASQELAGIVTFGDGASLDLGAGFALVAQEVRLSGDFGLAVAIDEKPTDDLVLLANVAEGADLAHIRLSVNGIDVSSGLSLGGGVLTASKDALAGAIVAGSLQEGEMLWNEQGQGMWSTEGRNWMSATAVGIPWALGSTAVFGYSQTQTSVALASPTVAHAVKITGDMPGLAFASATPTDALCFLRTGAATVSTAQDVSFAEATLCAGGAVETNSTGYLPPANADLFLRFKNLTVGDIKSFNTKLSFSTAQSYYSMQTVEEPVSQTATSVVYQYQWTSRYYSSNSGYEGYVNVRFEQDGLDVIAAAEKWSYRNYAEGEALPRGAAWDFTFRDSSTYYKFTDKDPNPNGQWQALTNLTLVLKDIPLAEAVTFRKEGVAAGVPVVTVGSGFRPNGLPVALEGVALQVGGGQSVRVGEGAFEALSGGPLAFAAGAGLTFAAAYEDEVGWTMGRLAVPGLSLPATGNVLLDFTADERIRAVPPETPFVLTSGAGLTADDLPRFAVSTSNGLGNYTAELGVSAGELTVLLRKRGLALIFR